MGVSMVRIYISLVHGSNIQYNHSNTGTKASEKLWKTLRIMIGTSNSNPRVRGILKNVMLSIQQTVQICIIIRSKVRVTHTETEIVEPRIVIVETMFLVDFTFGIIRVRETTHHTLISQSIQTNTTLERRYHCREQSDVS